MKSDNANHNYSDAIATHFMEFIILSILNNYVNNMKIYNHRYCWDVNYILNARLFEILNSQLCAILYLI